MGQPKANLASLQRHKDYYLLGGDLYFLVENYHFRVHRYFFDRESTFFQDKLSAPANPGAQPQGTSESNAFVLEDIKVTDFERLLWVFYNPKYSLYETTIEDWTIILELAHRWNFPEVKALAVRELEKTEMTDVDRVALYHKYDIDKTVLVPRYASLCSRDQTITYNEGLKLGMETALTLARARECARCKSPQSGGRSPLPADFRPDDMHSLITDLFGLPKSQPPSAVPEKPPTPKKDGEKQVNGVPNREGKGKGAKGDNNK